MRENWYLSPTLDKLYLYTFNINLPTDTLAADSELSLVLMICFAGATAADATWMEALGCANE